MHYAHIAWQETFVNSHKHTGLLHPLWLSYGMVKYRRHTCKFTTSSTIQRKAAPHRSEALSQRRHFVTLSKDKCVCTLMWFVWNSETCISFFTFLPANLSVRPIWPQTIIFIFLFLYYHSLTCSVKGEWIWSKLAFLHYYSGPSWPFHIECPPLLLEHYTAYYPDLSQYKVLFCRALYHRYICVRFSTFLYRLMKNKLMTSNTH